jgi:SAM-dependent methyltransferase
MDPARILIGHTAMSTPAKSCLTTSCPACAAHDVADFFAIKQAPIQSVATMKSRWAAMRIPRKDLTLSFCRHCGFIFNRDFDLNWDHFTHGYEDQQGFSPTFVQFITRITQRLIGKYKIYDQLVLEIGCGKGDFLRLITALGHNKGIGIDPAWEADRGQANPNITFIPEFFDPEHARVKADCIVCRHTLEHIYDANAFMKKVRIACGSHKPILFFEVPSIVRILEQQAFWDIFGEHCAYYSPGSLARLFRHNGFEVLDLYLDYDSQYLFIEAHPVDMPSLNIHPLEESVAELYELAQVFNESVQHKLIEWRERMNAFKLANKKVALWGGGSKAVGFLTQFHSIGVIEHVVDINPHLAGNFIPGMGIQYVKPEFMQYYKPDVVIAMNSVYLNEIRQNLADFGVTPELFGL